jgi:hypothetical protein
MINAVLTLGFGAVAIAIGFALCRRARDTEWPGDAWDRAGALLKISGAFVALLGFSLLIQPSGSLRTSPTVATHPLFSQRSGLQLELPRPRAAINIGGETHGLTESQRP